MAFILGRMFVIKIEIIVLTRKTIHRTILTSFTASCTRPALEIIGIIIKVDRTLFNT